MFRRAACGSERLIVLQERVRPILDRLYPSWATENLGIAYQEASDEREACQRLIARIESHGEVSGLLAPLDAWPKLAAESLHDYVWPAQPSTAWETDHRADAVLAAAKAVNSLLQKKLGRRDLSEVKLVQETFSDKPPEPGKPRLRFTSIEDDQTREDMREGACRSALARSKPSAIRSAIGRMRSWS